MAGKVTAGLALHWPCVSDISVSPPMGSRPGRGGDEHPPLLRSLVEHGRLYLTRLSGAVHYYDKIHKTVSKNYANRHDGMLSGRA